MLEFVVNAIVLTGLGTQKVIKTYNFMIKSEMSKKSIKVIFVQDLPNIIPIKCLSKLAKNLTNLRREDVSVYRDNNYICPPVLYDQTKCGFCSEIYNCHSWEDWFQLAKWLRRKRLKCQNYRKRKPIDKRW